MRREERFSQRAILVLVALAFLATPGWSSDIDDLDDAATPATDNLFLGSTGASLTTGDRNTGVGIGSWWSRASPRAAEARLDSRCWPT